MILKAFPTLAASQTVMLEKKINWSLNVTAPIYPILCFITELFQISIKIFHKKAFEAPFVHKKASSNAFRPRAHYPEGCSQLFEWGKIFPLYRTALIFATSSESNSSVVNEDTSDPLR